jgi:transposase
MHQVYQAGGKFFMDYAGQTVPIVNGETGEIKTAQIVVGVLGASNYTFCKAT